MTGEYSASNIIKEKNVAASVPIKAPAMEATNSVRFMLFIESVTTTGQVSVLFD